MKTARMDLRSVRAVLCAYAEAAGAFFFRKPIRFLHKVHVLNIDSITVVGFNVYREEGSVVRAFF